ncbi:MAG: LegC family aminotransferase [Alphaproteobacteria bacterium]
MPGPAAASTTAVDTLVERMGTYFRQAMGISGTVALHEPWFRGNEWAYVRDCLDSGWVSSVGAYVDRFEGMVAAACGARFGIAAVNGTAAAHIVLHALGVGQDDLVVCPALSFVATANAVAHCGATPVFIDIERSTLGLDPNRLAAFLAEDCERREDGLVHRLSGRRIAAVLPVHVFGHPVDMEAILVVSTEAGVPVIEDAAESLGSRSHGRPCGGLARAGVLSFNGNKLVTTGGGGMVVTDDEALARRVRHLTTTARTGTGWVFDHDEVGWNYRLPNLNAALGCAQMERLDELIVFKRRLHEAYRHMCEDLEGITLFTEQPWAESNYWLNAVITGDQAARDALLAAANGAGLQCRPCWRLLPELPMYRAAPVGPGGFPVAHDIAGRLVNLPSSPFLTRDAGR